MTPEEVAATGERARDLLSLANRDQISAPSRTTAVLANDVLALVSLVSEQAAALTRAGEQLNIERAAFEGAGAESDAALAQAEADRDREAERYVAMRADRDRQAAALARARALAADYRARHLPELSNAINAALTGEQPEVHGYCVCDGSIRARDCGVKAHREAARAALAGEQ